MFHVPPSLLLTFSARIVLFSVPLFLFLVNVFPVCAADCEDDEVLDAYIQELQRRTAQQCGNSDAPRKQDGPGKRHMVQSRKRKPKRSSSSRSSTPSTPLRSIVPSSSTPVLPSPRPQDTWTGAVAKTKRHGRSQTKTRVKTSTSVDPTTVIPPTSHKKRVASGDDNNRNRTPGKPSAAKRLRLCSPKKARPIGGLTTQPQTPSFKYLLLAIPASWFNRTKRTVAAFPFPYNTFLTAVCVASEPENHQVSILGQMETFKVKDTAFRNFHDLWKRHGQLKQPFYYVGRTEAPEDSGRFFAPAKRRTTTKPVWTRGLPSFSPEAWMDANFDSREQPNYFAGVRPLHDLARTLERMLANRDIRKRGHSPQGKCEEITREDEETLWTWKANSCHLDTWLATEFAFLLLYGNLILQNHCKPGDVLIRCDDMPTRRLLKVFCAIGRPRAL
jgi:hypothetical protein